MRRASPGLSSALICPCLVREPREDLMSRDLQRRDVCSQALLLSSLNVSTAGEGSERSRLTPEQDHGGVKTPIPLKGPPSDQLPSVLVTGQTSVRFVYISFSARDPNGRDAEYSSR